MGFRVYGVSRLWGFASMGFRVYGVSRLWGFASMGFRVYGVSRLWGFASMGFRVYGVSRLWGFASMGFRGCGATRWAPPCGKAFLLMLKALSMATQADAGRRRPGMIWYVTTGKSGGWRTLTLPIEIHGGTHGESPCPVLPTVVELETLKDNQSSRAHCHPGYSPMVPRQSQSYMYISNAEGGHCHLGYSPIVPRQSQSYMYMYISNAEGVIVT